MRALLLSCAAAIGFAASAHADQRFASTLVGHAILPAFTMAVPPADATRDALVSGKFAGPGNLRVDRPGAVMGDTGPMHGRRATGIAFPFIGQPVQGFSGIKPVTGEPDGGGDWRGGGGHEGHPALCGRGRQSRARHPLPLPGGYPCCADGDCLVGLAS